MAEVIYRGFCIIIDTIAKLMDKIRPGWSDRNSSRISEWKLMAYAYSRSAIGIVGGVLVSIFVIIGIIGPYIAFERYNEFPASVNPDLYFLRPCIPPWCDPWSENLPLLGTDNWGRDILSLVLHGARISLVISLIVVALGVPLGIILGLLAGYFGGAVDEVMMRITDVFIAFPALILAIAFATVLPSRFREVLYTNVFTREFFLSLFALSKEEIPQLASLLAVIFALVLVWWPGYARIIRGSVLSVKEQAFVEAARSLGLSTWRVLFRHILPNVLSPVIVMVTFDLGTATLLAAALSFLGIGPQDPVPELGFLVSKGREYFPDKWWIVMFPGIALFIIALGWNLLGDSLRDVLDPKTRRSLEFKVKGKKRRKFRSVKRK